MAKRFFCRVVHGLMRDQKTADRWKKDQKERTERDSLRTSEVCFCDSKPLQLSTHDPVSGRERCCPVVRCPQELLSLAGTVPQVVL